MTIGTPDNYTVIRVTATKLSLDSWVINLSTQQMGLKGKCLKSLFLSLQMSMAWGNTCWALYILLSYLAHNQMAKTHLSLLWFLKFILLEFGEYSSMYIGTHQLISLFIHLPSHLFIYLFAHWHINLFIYPLNPLIHTYTYIQTYINQVIHPCTHSPIYSYISSSTHQTRIFIKSLLYIRICLKVTVVALQAKWIIF